MPDIFTRRRPTTQEKLPANPDQGSKTQPSPKPSPQPTEKQISNSPFATFLQNPKGITLSGQDADEETLLFVRQDFFTNLPWILTTVLFAFLPALILPLLNFANISLDFLPTRFNSLILAFYYVLLVGYAFGNFLTWFYTIGIITSKKIFDIDFNNLSSISVASASLKDASDAKYTQQGFFQSFFDYGEVVVVIEATKEKLTFENCPRPAFVSDKLGDLIGGD